MVNTFFFLQKTKAKSFLESFSKFVNVFSCVFILQNDLSKVRRKLANLYYWQKKEPKEEVEEEVKTRFCQETNFLPPPPGRMNLNRA